MLRRVARVLRACLLCAGLLSLAWLPFSFLYAAHFAVQPLNDLWIISVVHGFFAVAIHIQASPVDLDFLGVSKNQIPLSSWLTMWAVHPYAYHASGVLTLTIPLWLLAVICLAWPVTSFIIARRRRKGRGFEVEAKPGAAVPPPES